MSRRNRSARPRGTRGGRNKQEVKRLLRALEQPDGFFLAVLKADSPRALHMALLAMGLAHRGMRIGPADELEPFTAEGLLAELDEVLAGERPELLLLDATQARPGDARAWAEAFRRLDADRDRLADRLAAPFLLAVPPWLAKHLPREAPGLWALRAHTVRLANRSRPLGNADLSPQLDGIMGQLSSLPEGPLAQLAGVLSGLMTEVHEAGADEQAVVIGRRIDGILRELVRRDRDAYVHNLVRNLNNMVISLVRIGRPEEALEASDEALPIARERAAFDRDDHLIDLARTLDARGAALEALGRFEEAIEASSEAVAAFRELVEGDRDAFLPELENSLDLLGIALEKAGRPAEAVAPVRETVEILRERALAEPDAPRTKLFEQLATYGQLLSELGRHEESAEAYREVVEQVREMSDAPPRTRSILLALGLLDLGQELARSERFADALAAASESVTLLRALSENGQPGTDLNLARALHVLGIALLGRGHADRAVEAHRESLVLFRGALERNPKTASILEQAPPFHYRRACAAAGVPVDEALVGPLEAALEG